MFKRPFSFKGRIRRLEYVLSLIIGTFIFIVIAAIVVNIGFSFGGDDGIFAVVLLSYFWFILAQGAKRCHDIGSSGWWQLFPFYRLILLFREGDNGINRYGENPKGIGNNQQYSSSPQSQNDHVNNQSGYQGGYSGGHNNPTNYSSTQNQSNEDGYNSGNLYN